MREIEIYGDKMIVVPKKLRKRFSNMEGVFLTQDGKKSWEYHWKTGAIVLLPEIVTEHFRKCLRP